MTYEVEHMASTVGQAMESGGQAMESGREKLLLSGAVASGARLSGTPSGKVLKNAKTMMG